MYKQLSIFINRANERRFNDALMNVVICEIKLKSGSINEETILPRYYKKGVWYNGEFHSNAAMIKDLVPKKALLQLQKLIKEGSAENFEKTEQIKNWITDKTGISNCSLSAIN